MSSEKLYLLPEDIINMCHYYNILLTEYYLYPIALKAFILELPSNYIEINENDKTYYKNSLDNSISDIHPLDNDIKLEINNLRKKPPKDIDKYIWMKLYNEKGEYYYNFKDQVISDTPTNNKTTKYNLKTHKSVALLRPKSSYKMTSTSTMQNSLNRNVTKAGPRTYVCFGAHVKRLHFIQNYTLTCDFNGVCKIKDDGNSDGKNDKNRCISPVRNRTPMSGNNSPSPFESSTSPSLNSPTNIFNKHSSTLSMPFTPTFPTSPTRRSESVFFPEPVIFNSKMQPVSVYDFHLSAKVFIAERNDSGSSEVTEATIFSLTPSTRSWMVQCGDELNNKIKNLIDELRKYGKNKLISVKAITDRTSLADLRNTIDSLRKELEVFRPDVAAKYVLN